MSQSTPPSSSRRSSATVASSLSSRKSSVESCWQHRNHDPLPDWHEYEETDSGIGAGRVRKCRTIGELREQLQREPMDDEIAEYVHTAAGPTMMDGCWTNIEDGIDVSSEMIGAQLIHEAGLVFACSSLSPLTPGTCFNVSGTTTFNCERFSINLTLGGPMNNASRSDIALHINPRLPQNYIVRNCRVNGVWGREEVTSPLPFRLQRGAPFAVQVLVTETDYYIAIDGRHFAAFRHRLPYTKVGALQVYGDVLQVQVDQLSILQYPDSLSPAKPTAAGGFQEGATDGNAATQDVHEMTDAQAAVECNRLRKWSSGSGDSNVLEMPFYGRLPQKLRVGQTLHICGTVKLLPHSFYVNLQRGQHIWPHPLIAFHLNPRFAGVGAQNVICRNSWHNGKWDREQRSEIYTDFMPSRTFHMAIRAEQEKYVVSVNGRMVTEYMHKLEVGTVDTVHVQGDIRLSGVIVSSPVAKEA